MLSSLMVGVYHPRRSIRASASVVASIRVGRYEHPRRSIRASASVDADGGDSYKNYCCLVKG
ncbi:hypothetical protein [Leyella stercorea]